MLLANKTWKRFFCPENVNIGSSELVFRVIFNFSGDLDWFRVRIVTGNFSQIYGLDYKVIFASKAKIDTWKDFLAILAMEYLKCD